MALRHAENLLEAATAPEQSCRDLLAQGAKRIKIQPIHPGARLNNEPVTACCIRHACAQVVPPNPPETDQVPHQLHHVRIERCKRHEILCESLRAHACPSWTECSLGHLGHMRVEYHFACMQPLPAFRQLHAAHLVQSNPLNSIVNVSPLSVGFVEFLRRLRRPKAAL